MTRFLSFLLSSIVLLISCSDPLLMYESTDEDGNVQVKYFPRIEAQIIHFEVSFSYEWQGETKSYSDNGVLMLPENYPYKKEQTDLIFYCHSGGGSVGSNWSECESVAYNKYLVSKGYALLSMAAMPDSFAKKLQIDVNRTVGSDIALRCCEEGYSQILKEYTFSGKVYLLSNSNGGLLASNLVHFTQIPFCAQCGIAPLISIENNAWYIKNGNNSGGLFRRYQNRANIISLYHMSSCFTQEELDNARYEVNRVGDYDPYAYYVNHFDVVYPIPYYIFSCIDDDTVYYSIASSFADTMNVRKKDQIIVDTTTSYGAHNVQAKPKVLGSFLFKGNEYPLNEVYVKIYEFFSSK